MNCPMCGELWNGEKCQSCSWKEQLSVETCSHTETFRSRDGRRCCECGAWIPGSFGVQKKTLLLLLLLLIPVSSQAQSLKLPTAVFASAAGADWASTYSAVTRHHLREQNPLISQLQSRPVEMVATGAAIDLAGVIAWKHLMRSHSRLGAVGLYVGTAARLYLASRNISRSRQSSFWSGGTVGIK